ncbi:hypothetical protein ANN_06804 [Periplaneta americana]|uniref:Uncharacterized protein n=1 Tax=Periplaneta americana TaxID=6978 RepID=A0ABQ8TH32_PERAM|nr:hypothetical protein ANN_06804 [Periplaneta americana]
MCGDVCVKIDDSTVYCHQKTLLLSIGRSLDQQLFRLASTLVKSLLQTSTRAICGKAAPSRRSVFHWVSQFKDGRDCAEKRKRTGRTATAHKQTIPIVSMT